MIKLNTLQYNPINLDLKKLVNYSWDSLKGIDASLDFKNLLFNFKSRFNFSEIKTFSFSKEGFLSLFIELSNNSKSKIAVSLGECEALVEGAKLYKELGFDIEFINLKKDGSVDLAKLKQKDINFLFLSSYVMDTFYETDLSKLKEFTNAKIISNASANFSIFSDAIYFDNYKLCGFPLSGVLLFNEEFFNSSSLAFIDSIAIFCCFQALNNLKFSSNMKEIFKEKLIKKFKDNIYFFVDNSKTLPYSLHFGLKNIKARELIRTLVFDDIFLSNGEGCSLGLSKPSRIIQSMGYDEPTSRNSISLNFSEDFSEDLIENIVEKIFKRYSQIVLLS